MSESYESTSNPISSFIMGMILCFSSTYAFWLNENRFDYGKEAAKTKPLKSLKKSYLKALDKKNVSLTHKIKTNEMIMDPVFFSKKANLFTLSRSVQVYAWVKRQRDNRTYYELEWTGSPDLIRGNIKPKWPDFQTQIKSFRMGKMKIDTKDLEFSYSDKILSDISYFSPNWQSSLQQSGRYFYPIGQNIGQPQHNDHRLKFEIRDPISRGTLFGKIQQGKIVPYYGPKRNTGGYFKKMLKSFIFDKDVLFHLSKLERKEAIAKLRKDFETTMTIVRVVSWLMLAFAITMLFSPLTFFTDFIPYVGGAVKTILFFIGLLVSTVICLAIYLTAFVFSSWWGTIIVLTLIGAYVYSKLNKKKQKDIKKFSKNIKAELSKPSSQHASLLQAQDQSWTKEDCIAFLRIAGKLVAADNKVEAGEINFLRNFAGAHHIPIEHANKLVQEGADAPNYDISTIRPEMAAKVIRALSDLCLADGYLNEMEYKLMLDICKKAKLSKRKLHNILDQEMLKLIQIYRSQNALKTT